MDRNCPCVGSNFALQFCKPIMKERIRFSANLDTGQDKNMIEEGDGSQCLRFMDCHIQI